MAASYDDERRFLASLSSSRGPFLLVGFDGAERQYLLERIRECLKVQGHHLNLSHKIDASASGSLEEVQGACLGLFDAQGWEVVESIEAVKKDQLSRWIEAIKASPFHLILTSSKKLEGAWMQAFSGSPTLDVSGEKPWDKPKRLSAWLQAMVGSFGMQMDFRQASLLCESLQGDRQMIKTHCQALAASQGYQGTLKLEAGDLDAHAQVWKWLDQIWQGQVSLAFSQIPPLLEEDASGISLLALVRQQWHAFILSTESKESAAGGYDRTQQKAQKARLIGYGGLCKGAELIAKAQWDLKSSREASEVLQLLIVRLAAICNPQSVPVGR